MPEYDYRCPACDHPFSVRCKIDQRNEARCPECGHEPITAMPAAPGFAFKGGSPTAFAGRKAPPARPPRNAGPDLDIPTVGPDGKLYDTRTGRKIAETPGGKLIDE